MQQCECLYICAYANEGKNVITFVVILNRVSDSTQPLWDVIGVKLQS